MVLQSIRERLTGILAFFILGILVIPFAFVGVNSYFQSGGDNLVARVNEKDITLSDFNDSYSNYRRSMQQRMGAAFDPVQFETLIARREHLDSMIDEEVLKQSVASIRLSVDDQKLASEIRKIPAFQLDGEFSHEVYTARLTSQNLSVSQFEREMRTQIVMSQLPRSILSSSFSTRAELEDFVRLQDEKRGFQMVLVSPVIDEAAAAPEAAQIQAYYEAHPDQFQSEEQVEIEYLELNVQDIPLANAPDEEFLRSRFEQQKLRFVSPEQRRASHILIEAPANADDAVIETARQEAAELAERARQGEDFAELAEQNSDDLGSAASGGDLGWVEPGLMSDTFEEALYLLSMESPISEPVQTGFGWHVIQLHEIQESSGMGYEEARETLILEHREEESEREFLDLADRMVDLIYEDPTTLDAAALDLGLEVQTAGPFGRAGGEGIAANPEVVAAAFSDIVLLQGSVSDPVDLDDNHMIMMRLKQHIPASVQPLEVVRDRIVAELRAEQANEAARARAETLMQRLAEEPETGLEALAAEAGLEVVTTEAAVRRNFVPDRAVVEAVFDMLAPEPDATITKVVPASSGFALVVLQSVTPGDLEEGATLSEDQYRRLLANSAATIEATGLMAQLRAQAKVDVFEDRLK